MSYSEGKKKITIIQFETSIHPQSRAGVAVSCKKKEK